MKNKAIEWLKTQENPAGGIFAWPEARVSYPEVTGYLIPTLLDYDEGGFAARCGDWLARIQNEDGSFDGLHGGPQAFDTAAIVEGFRALSMEAEEKKALAWLETQVIGDGLKTSPIKSESRPYNIRALAIMGHKITIESAAIYQEPTGRMHYLMYALEGLFNMGYADMVRDAITDLQTNKSGLLPYYLNGSGSDTCATAQAACLKIRVGLPAGDLVEAVRATQNPDGSFPHDKSDSRRVAWPCKYYLDMENYLIIAAQ